jgi:hypothetical protein
MSDALPIQNRIQQRDVSLPLPFILALEFVIRKVEENIEIPAFGLC